MTQEQWRPIEGYEGLYEVSSMGRVRRVKGYDSLGRLRLGRILRPLMNANGYLQVSLCKEGKHKMFMVHRLVAQAFITNPEGLPIINHKDENPKNNRVDNLEWCTYEYNNNYGTRNERIVHTMISKGMYDPELCGVIKSKGKNKYQRDYYQKNLEKMREQKREYQREYRRRKKTSNVT